MISEWIKKSKPYSYHIEGRYSLGGKELYCDRSSSFGSYGFPSCFNNPATKKVTIHYDEYSRPDHLVLCDECAEELRKDLERHGYENKVEKLSKEDKEAIIEYALSG